MDLYDGRVVIRRMTSITNQNLVWRVIQTLVRMEARMKMRHQERNLGHRRQRNNQIGV